MLSSGSCKQTLYLLNIYCHCLMVLLSKLCLLNLLFLLLEMIHFVVESVFAVSIVYCFLSIKNRMGVNVFFFC